MEGKWTSEYRFQARHIMDYIIKGKRRRRQLEGDPRKGKECQVSRLFLSFPLCWKVTHTYFEKAVSGEGWDAPIWERVIPPPGLFSRPPIPEVRLEGIMAKRYRVKGEEEKKKKSEAEQWTWWWGIVSSSFLCTVQLFSLPVSSSYSPFPLHSTPLPLSLFTSPR